MNLFTKQKQTHRHREQTCGCQGAGGREGLGERDQQMQTIICRMDKQQGPTVQHRELYSISCNNFNGKVSEKEYRQMDGQIERERERERDRQITESLCCTPETNTTL